MQVAWSEMASSVESVCAGELHNDAVNVAVCRARTSRLRAMHCSWLAGGGTQEAVSGKRATLRSVSELRGCECEILREKRLSGGREQQRNSRMVWHGSR